MVTICILASLGWFAITTIFISDWEPKVVAAIYLLVLLAAVAT